MSVKIVLFLMLLLFHFPERIIASEKSSTHDLSTNIFEDRRTIPDGGDFSLLSSQGLRSLSQFREKIVILLFGYLSCPDICPTQLRKISELLEKIDSQDRKDVQVLFVTLDPERDDLEHLDKFVQYFDKSIIALTGDLKQIKHVAGMYGVKFSKVKTKDGKSYNIKHSVASYILSPDNTIRYILAHDVTADDMVEIIHNLFKKFYPIHL